MHFFWETIEINRDIFVPFRSFEDAPAMNTVQKNIGIGETNKFLQISLTWMGQKPPFRTSKCCYQWMCIPWIWKIWYVSNRIDMDPKPWTHEPMNPWTHEPMNPRGIFVTSFRRLSASLRLASTNLGRHGNNELGLSENGVYSIEHGILMRSSVHLRFQFLWWKIVFFWPTRGLVFWIRASAAKIHLHTHCLGGGVVNTVKTHGKTSQRMADGPMANL